MTSNIDIIDKNDRRIDVSGTVWIWQGGEGTVELDWSLINLPAHVLAPAREYMIHLLESAAASSIRSFFGQTLRGLSECPAVHASATVDETVFMQLRVLLAHDRPSQSRFRTFYRHSMLSEWPGFDRGVYEVLRSVRLGNAPVRRAPFGRNAALLPDDEEWLWDAMRRHRDELTDIERILLIVCKIFGSNAGPISLISEHHLREVAPGEWKLAIPRHKKTGLREGDARPRDVSPAIAAAIGDLLAANRARAESSMQWPDGTIGLPNGVNVPLFMRSRPRPKQADPACTARVYALHHLPGEITTMIADVVARLTEFDERDELHVTARVMRRTTLSRMRADGVPDVILQDIADHGSPNYIPNYAHLGPRIVGHLDRTVGRNPSGVETLVREFVVADDVDFYRRRRPASKE